MSKAGVKVTEFNRKFPGPNGDFGEIDVGTNNFIIEATEQTYRKK
jgi:hypothetical protein